MPTPLPVVQVVTLSVSTLCNTWHETGKASCHAYYTHHTFSPVSPGVAGPAPVGVLGGPGLVVLPPLGPAMLLEEIG